MGHLREGVAFGDRGQQRGVVERASPCPQVQEELEVAGRPGSGDGQTPATPSPPATAASATPRTAAARTAGSRTTPPRPTAPRPASNWGLTSSSRSPSRRVSDASTGTTRRSEMNDRSATVRSTGPPSCSAVSPRTLVRSSTRTRGSRRNDRSSCP